MIVFLARNENKYSINALLGSLESRDLVDRIDIRILDYRSMDIRALRDFVSCYDPIVFSFSFATLQYFEVLEVVRQLKAFFENAIYIAGGPHPSGMVEQTFGMGFDYVFIGEAEETFTNFVRQLIENKKVSDLGDAFCVLGEGRVVVKDKELVDLNGFKPFSEKFKRFGPIEITRGCPNRCHYCQTPSLFGRAVRHRSVDSVVDAVKVMKKYNLTDIRFISPNAFSYGSMDGKVTNVEEVHRLLENVRKVIGREGRIFFGSFPSEVRPEHVTQEMISLIKEFCDNDNLVLGAQSGSQRVLDSIKRGHTVEDVYRAVEIIIENGLKANVDFIFGLPYEEDDDVSRTIDFIRELVKLGARIHAHYYMPLPGTPLARFEPKKFEAYDKFVKKELLPKGYVFGKWERQKKVSQRLFELINSGTRHPTCF